MSRRLSMATIVVIAACGIANAEPGSSAQRTLARICHRAALTDDKLTLKDCREFFDAKRSNRDVEVKSAEKNLSNLGPQSIRAEVKPTGNNQPAPREADPKRLFVRADAIDNFWYSLAPPGAGLTGVQGASVSFTDDRVAGTQSATINGRVSYLILPPAPTDLDKGYEYAFAGWISGNGTWKQPLKRPENTALKIGADIRIAQ
jgi:hypothetical protein